MKPLHYRVRSLGSKLVILFGSLIVIALGFRLSHGRGTLESFVGVFLIASGAQIALWSLGIRLELLANTAAGVAGVSTGHMPKVAGESSIKESIENLIEARFRHFEAMVEGFEEITKAQIQLLEGRTMAISAHVLAEASIEPENPMKPNSKDRLERAVALCQKAYDRLNKVDESSETMALNNLVYYSTVLNDRTRSDFILSKARHLFQLGQERDSVNLLLTACMAILQFGDDLNEKSRAREVLRAIERRSQATNREQREASLYLAYFYATEDGAVNEAPNLGPQADS